MSNSLTTHEPEPIEDDGFGGSLTSGRLVKGTLLKWTDAKHWQDRDGVAPPSPMLVVAITEVLQKWEDGKPEIKSEKPLPDPKVLNDAIPVKQWPIGPDKKPTPPWRHTVVVYLVDLKTGGFYTFASPTIGAHIAFDHLKESVITMRALRGAKCMALVNLAERPMKTSFGMKQRPYFEIIGWKTPGDDSKSVPAKPAPQLSGPSAAAPTATSTPTPTPASTPAPAQKRRPKPPVNVGAETVAQMSDVKAVSLAEELNDEVGF